MYPLLGLIYYKFLDNREQIILAANFFEQLGLNYMAITDEELEISLNCPNWLNKFSGSLGALTTVWQEFGSYNIFLVQTQLPLPEKTFSLNNLDLNSEILCFDSLDNNPVYLHNTCYGVTARLLKKENDLASLYAIVSARKNKKS